MTKTDLIKHLATAHLITQTQAAAILDDLIEQIAAALSVGDRVHLTGLGVLRTHTLAARSGRAVNGLPYHAPARTVVKLHASASLEARLPAPAEPA